MKAYLIDPKLQRVAEIELPDDGMLGAMRGAIGCAGMDHVTISDEHDALWVDDESLRRDRCWGWTLPLLGYPVAGKGLIIGADDLGRTRAPYIPLSVIARDITWLGEIIPELTEIHDGNILRIIVTYRRAHEK